MPCAPTEALCNFFVFEFIIHFVFLSLSDIVHPRQPLAWLDPGVFGTLGVGGGMAVAAKALRPKSEVWILFGDGSSAWSLSEVDTMVCISSILIV